MSEQRRALIVGASRGLGFRLAQQYRAQGWDVVATVRTERPSPELERLTPRIRIISLDVNKPAEIEAARAQLAAERFDLVFANAGVAGGPEETIADVTTDEFVRVMTTNALGPMRCVEAFAPLVREKGTIAVMSSGLGSVADNQSGGWEVYRASKAALNMLLRSFAARHRGDGRTILAVCPGWSRTDMGGPSAPLDPDDSVRGVIKTLAALAGSGKHDYVNHQGQSVAW